MPDWKQVDLAREVFSGVLAPQKVYQVIFNVQVSTTPTTARITFVPMLDAAAFVTLYQDGVQIRGWWAVPYAPSHYGVTFTDLPQNTTLGFTIAVMDPRPAGAQLPRGIVTYTGILNTPAGRRWKRRSLVRPWSP